jgi:hypothetical protein
MNKLVIPEISQQDIRDNNYPDDFFKTALAFEFASPQERRKYEQMVTTLFFHGGPIPSDGDFEYALRGRRMFTAIIGSYRPSHEDKKTVCAAILRCIAD